MKFTRREKHVLLIMVFATITVAFIKQEIIMNWETCLLLFFVAPLGFYIATDPERRIRKE
jgi:hypothetical protein